MLQRALQRPLPPSPRIGEYLNEIKPAARLLPQDREKRARCRSICGEMHSSFAPMRSALPMNLKGDLAKQEPIEVEELEVEF
jgi:glutathione S-transferase